MAFQTIIVAFDGSASSEVIIQVLGSVSSQVVAEAPCSVLVVKEKGAIASQLN